MKMQPANQWHRERAARLHKICVSINTRTARGEKQRKLIQWFAWYCRERCYKCNPQRKLNFTVSTICRAYRIWNRSGQIAAVLLPRYTPRRSVFTAPMLIRFAKFVARTQFPSMKIAFEKFAARGGNSGLGRRGGKPLKISYGQLQYNFPASRFKEFQSQLKAMDSAHKKLGELLMQTIFEIRNAFPDRPPRRRVKREITFEI